MCHAQIWLIRSLLDNFHYLTAWICVRTTQINELFDVSLQPTSDEFPSFGEPTCYRLKIVILLSAIFSFPTIFDKQHNSIMKAWYLRIISQTRNFHFRSTRPFKSSTVSCLLCLRIPPPEGILRRPIGSPFQPMSYCWLAFLRRTVYYRCASSRFWHRGWLLTHALMN